MGQNFMEDSEVLDRIVEVARLNEDSFVVEVGPGTGALTRRILASGAQVRAVEKDDRLFMYLRRTIEKFGDLGEGLALEEGGLDGEGEEASSVVDNISLHSIKTADHRLEVVHGDVLKLDLAALAQGGPVEQTDDRNAKRASLLANLPYNITRDFLYKAVPLGDSFSSLVLMLQHEAAERMVKSTPNSPDWRAMNVILQFYSSPSYVFRVDRRKYSPVPKVDGAVVDFKLKDASQRMKVPSEREFIALVKRGFLQKRKRLSNSLRPLLEGPEIQECLVSCGLSAEARAQELSLEDFVKLSWTIHEFSGQK
jgi:16S rRNA (adenine1518-N6/adenine1519-N6)-dimethyltransferase